MNCSRKGCDSIMCDTYINDIGYVCNHCQNEFKDYLAKQDLHPKSVGAIRKELAKFMQTEKDKFVQGDEITPDEFFTMYTRD